MVSRASPEDGELSTGRRSSAAGTLANSARVLSQNARKSRGRLSAGLSCLRIVVRRGAVPVFGLLTAVRVTLD